MKLDRLIGILSLLLKQEKMTAPQLAEKFEVSVRTILRDVETINRAGIPVATARGMGGGISIMEGYKIDRTLLTSAEMTAIMEGLKSLDSVSGTNRYRQLMDKLSVSEAVMADAHILIDLATWNKNAVSAKIEQIKKAIEEKKLLSFCYYSTTGTEERSAEPYRLIFQWSSWYLWGFCKNRQDFRLFKLTRMTNLQTKEEIFSERIIPQYKGEGLQHSQTEVKATVKFSKAVKWKVVDDFGAENFTEDESGDILLTFTWSDKPSLFSFIAGFRENAEILSPKEYRKEFAELLKKISRKYET